MTARRFTVEGDPMTVFRIAEAHGYKITHPRWWERTYSIPRWMVWCAVPSLLTSFIRGVVEIIVKALS